ncbi:MAG: hypothetical protein ACE5IC_09580 [Candidatus Brocadiales bacterium]
MERLVIILSIILLFLGCASGPSQPPYHEQINMILADPNMLLEEKKLRIMVLQSKRNHKVASDIRGAQEIQTMLNLMGR